MTQKYRFTVVTFFVLLLAVLLFAVAALMAADRRDSLEGTAGAEATVISTGASRERSAGRGWNVNTWADVRFALPDGRSVTTRLRPSPDTVIDGAKTVRIRYKSHDPRIAATEETSLAFYAGIGLFVSFGVICLVAAHFVSLRDGAVQRGVTRVQDRTSAP